ncbi:monocarboxylate transporter 2-like [Diadema antillarum]|uniref:monocarboxylate transporter 2-like n=1 Tax=Diadema antillarum TaxID=105358 RepID=UPI003A89A71E
MLIRSPRRWLIVVAAFFVLFLDEGTNKSYGLLLEDVTRNFQASTSFVGFVFGMSQGLAYILSPVNSPLSRLFSVRQLAMTGALLGSTGVILASFASNVSQFAGGLLTFGIGYTTVILTANTCPAEYFPDSFKVASGILITGSGVGTMVLPIITEEVRGAYGWRASFLLLGGLNLHSMVYGALVKPRKLRATTSLNASQDRARRADDSTEECDSDSVQHENVVLTQLGGVINAAHDNGGEVINEGSTESGRSESDAENPHRAESNSSVSNLSNSPLGEREETSHRSPTRSSSCGGILGIIDLYLYRDYPVEFGCFSMTVMLYCFIHVTWALFLIPNAETKGFDSATAVYLATIGGACNTVGRFLSGIISSRQWMKDHVFFFLVCVISGLAFGLNYVTIKYEVLAVLAGVNGLADGMKTAMINIIVQGMIPKDRFQTAMSIIFFVGGCASPISGYLGGAIYDATESYNVTFCILGAAEVLSGLFILLPLAIGKRCCRQAMGASE